MMSTLMRAVYDSFLTIAVLVARFGQEFCNGYLG